MEEIRPLATDDEARRCAAMMCATEPWITIGRTFEESLAQVQNAEREVYVASDGDPILGFIIINMHGAFAGYIQTVCVDASVRSRSRIRIHRRAEDIARARNFINGLSGRGL